MLSENLHRSMKLERAGRGKFQRIGVFCSRTPMRVTPRPNSVRSMQPLAGRRRVPEGHKGDLRDLGIFFDRPFSFASCA